MASVVDVAEALKDALNAGPLYEAESQAIRTYTTDTELGDNETLRVIVRPSPQGFAQLTAGNSAKQTDLSVQVAVIQRCATDAETDAAVELLSDIEIACRGLVCSGYRCVQNDVPLTFDEAYLHQSGVFRGVVRFTFRGVE